MPDSWAIHQKRFETQSSTKLINVVGGVCAGVVATTAAGAIASATSAGAAIGSVIPGPGTVAGAVVAGTVAAVGAAGSSLVGLAGEKGFSHVNKHYMGQFTRSIGGATDREGRNWDAATAFAKSGLAKFQNKNEKNEDQSGGETD